jgi:hypothetical protein
LNGAPHAFASSARSPARVAQTIGEDARVATADARTIGAAAGSATLPARTSFAIVRASNFSCEGNEVYEKEYTRTASPVVSRLGAP